MSSKNRYGYTLNRKQVHGFLTIKSALIARNDHIKKNDLEKHKTILSTPILRNEKGDAIIEIFNKHKEKIIETSVDDDDYYILKQYHWNMGNLNYISGYINGKNIALSRFVVKCYDSSKDVDHNDSNTMNNKKSNLTIVTKAENSQNKSSAKGSTSKYVGVSYDKSKNKWKAFITLNGISELHKTFNTELEAVKARDAKALELNKLKGTFFKINLT